MVINFMKKIVEGKSDETTHLKFVRYSKGHFEKEEIIIKVMGKKVQVQTGYEYIDVLLKILAEHATEDVSLKGKIISSKKDITKKLADHNIEVPGKRGNKYNVEATLSPEAFKSFVYDMDDCFLLLTVTSGSNSVKVKPGLPKPGDLKEKLATGKFDMSALPDIKEEFAFDTDDFKKELRVKHFYDIDDIIVDPALLESDPLKARLEAKRKGKVIRKKTIDGAEESTEHPFEV